ncbi:secretion system type I outer membrane efflux pump lipoprotein NodT [Neokomagataea thailandica NBRC 106555]|uniref:Efflux transporter outer membrane subunit n=2 Tax=Neokomagataea TaxID=1223423 RepID=A0A4Y6V2C3_9PROT|nr:MULTISPECIES: efflux transporter outer membrane subunit [Neokomagataea]QDH24179.1 efflux transporter outer membrane subunit [Neokomagataea tanensis]GBR50640.1 secretion system type I outer membrane efflux pump lipoprotein NodT [Neokomagataea thailandica NBRC 106555]
MNLNRFSSLRAILLGTMAVPALSGCMVGPDYKRPQAIIAPQFKEAPPPAGWTKTRPDLALFPKGDWWTIFNDPTLNDLENRIATSNQSLKEYEAQYRKAASTIDSVRAQLYPTLSGSFSFNRNSASSSTNNTWATGPSASWTIDVWGRIRRQVEQQVAATQADAALVAAMRLSYQLQLAQDYFDLRYQDSLIDLYTNNVGLYTRNLQIVENQLEAGVADPTAALQARYQLESTQASLANAHVARAQYEHAIAILTGRTPSEVSIPSAPLPKILPPAPVALPSTLLERRPDVAQAERNMEAYNAAIGYAIGAYYPEVSLSASYGYSGNPIQQLIQTATRTWGLGAAATETIFNGGARTAAVRSAEADYDNAVATYRQTVLAAIQDTEDQMSNLHYLDQQLTMQNKALATAQDAVRVSTNEYLAGTQIYTTVITSEQTALQYEQTQLSIRQQQFLAEVKLLTDLGGGWNSTSVPSKDSLQTDNPLLPSFIQKDKNGVRPAQ